VLSNSSNELQLKYQRPQKSILTQAATLSWVVGAVLTPSLERIGSSISTSYVVVWFYLLFYLPIPGFYGYFIPIPLILY
jgi:hypothetical protein